MRLCDEEGIVVIDETTAVGVNLQFGGGANFGGERIRMINNLMYIELKMGYSDDDPAWIGYVKTSKSRIKIF